MYTDKRLHQLWLNIRRPRRYQPVGELLSPLRNQLSDPRKRGLDRIHAAWPEIVGPDLADLAFPSALQSDILIISVASPAVKFTVEQIYRSAILTQVREVAGKRIRDIKCTLSSNRAD